LLLLVVWVELQVLLLVLLAGGRHRRLERDRMQNQVTCECPHYHAFIPITRHFLKADRIS
jgi:hypothetical protein